jgi:hypothetical protein
MQQADYTIVSYRPEYKAQIVEVQKHLWGSHPELNAAYLDWKHLRNPYVSEPLIYLAKHEERVVGMRSFVGARWEFGSPPFGFDHLRELGFGALISLRSFRAPSTISV